VHEWLLSLAVGDWFATTISPETVSHFKFSNFQLAFGHPQGQGSAAKCQTITFPKPNLDYANGGFFSLTTYDAESWIEGDNFHIGHERMKDNGDGTMTIDFNCNTAYSVTVSEGWNGTFRLFKPVNVQETIDYVNNQMTIAIKMK
jgi:hypothetical protein